MKVNVVPTGGKPLSGCISVAPATIADIVSEPVNASRAIEELTTARLTIMQLPSDIYKKTDCFRISEFQNIFLIFYKELRILAAHLLCRQDHSHSQ